MSRQARPETKRIVGLRGLFSHSRFDHCARGRRRAAALFGSRARGDNRADSDIDIMIEIALEAPVGAFEYVEITQTIADLFPAPVDVSNRRKLKPFVRPSAEREAAPAF